MARKRVISGIQIGMSSLMLIFVVLCLTVFSILSLMSAMSDMRLSEKTLAASQAYYKADSIAEEKLRDIDGMLQSPGYILELGDLYEPINGHVHYEVPINEGQSLRVELELINSAIYGEKRYNILKWQEVNKEENDIENSLPVWTGE